MKKKNVSFKLGLNKHRISNLETGSVSGGTDVTQAHPCVDGKAIGRIKCRMHAAGQLVMQSALVSFCTAGSATLPTNFKFSQAESPNCEQQ